MAPRKVGLTALALVAMVVAPAPPALAATDPQGDATDSEADHDLLEVTFAETGDDVAFEVTVAGSLRAPAAGIDEVRIEFRVVTEALYTPGLSPQVGGSRHSVGASNENVYGVFRHAGLGYALPSQPASGVSTATWSVPKAYLDATAAHRPVAGDYLSDIVVSAMVLGLAVDSATMPDVRLAIDAGPGTTLHLRAAGSNANEGQLRTQAPTGATPATATLWLEDTLQAEWVSEPLQGNLKLHDLTAVLWLSATTSTPALADESFLVDLFDQAPDGTRTLVARRAESVSPVPGATTNLFIAPGAPQRMPFQLEALPDADRIAHGHRVVLQASVTGVFSSEAGPMVVYYDSADHDSFVLAGKKPVPRPDKSACPGGDGVSNLPRSRC